MKRITDYEAHDGKRFATPEECKTHEKNLKLSLLAHRTPEQIEAAIDRSHLELANAIEFAGNLISEKRRAVEWMLGK
jgi:hypothetical protein